MRSAPPKKRALRGAPLTVSPLRSRCLLQHDLDRPPTPLRSFIAQPLCHWPLCPAALMHVPSLLFPAISPLVFLESLFLTRRYSFCMLEIQPQLLLPRLFLAAGASHSICEECRRARAPQKKKLLYYSTGELQLPRHICRLRGLRLQLAHAFEGFLPPCRRNNLEGRNLEGRKKVRVASGFFSFSFFFFPP